MNYILYLRLFHIVCGVFWAGATFYLALFIIPAVKALGPDGGKFMQQLSKTNKLPLIMTLAGTLNVLSGVLLVMLDSNYFTAAWFGSHMGIVFSIGGTCALIAWAIGITVNRNAVMQIAKTGAAIAAGGAPPTAEQQATLLKYRTVLFKATNVVAWLLLLAVVCMSVARYVG